ATAYLHPRAGVTAEDIAAAYSDFAAVNPFITVVDRPPATKLVSGTNLAALHAGWQDGVVVVTVAIDNLMKGAAGQAVQDLNLRFGLSETAGLESRTLWP
ncbi:MAG TPA: N-acetyl-gamma-glutamyl-phosphate reductase, partial [Candidatus Dormibacteraeota bacterium]|nr:N-acetyl-gamma-glutamyl-phosphate reductase [Candidatus Dormibacteraeota bacterium]